MRNTLFGLVAGRLGASLLTRFLSLSGAGDFLSSLVIDAGASTFAVLMIIVLIYLLLGMFLEPIGAMLLTLPIVLPIIDSAGLSLIWFGVVIVKLLEIGLITPPVGLNVFVLAGVLEGKVEIGKIFSGLWRFLGIDLVVLALLIIFPIISLYIPTTMN